MTFQEARQTCQAEGADLTIISDSAENDFILELFYLVSINTESKTVDFS